MAKKPRQQNFVLFPVHCLACGTLFHPKRAHAKVCSVTCRKRVQRLKDASKHRQTAADERKPVPAPKSRKLKARTA